MARKKRKNPWKGCSEDLGDGGGYASEPWMLVPYRNAAEGSAETKFYEVHSRERNIVGRTNGVLKIRWRCLLGARELHYSLKKSVQIDEVIQGTRLNEAERFRTSIASSLSSLLYLRK